MMCKNENQQLLKNIWRKDTSTTQMQLHHGITHMKFLVTQHNKAMSTAQYTI